MGSMLLKGVIRNGRVEVAEMIDLPYGTEVVVTTKSSVPEVDDLLSPWGSTPIAGCPKKPLAFRQRSRHAPFSQRGKALKG